MEISGKVIKILPLQQGVSKVGKSWSKQEFIVETMDQYPKKVLVSVFNPGQNIQVPQMDSLITASIDVESHSFFGKDGIERWSTEVHAWKIVPYQSQMDAQANAFFSQQTAQPQAQPQVAQPQQFQVPTQPQFPQQPQTQFAQPQQMGKDGLPF